MSKPTKDNFSSVVYRVCRIGRTQNYSKRMISFVNENIACRKFIKKNAIFMNIRYTSMVKYAGGRMNKISHGLSVCDIAPTGR